jgi:alpha-L-fucosidase
VQAAQFSAQVRYVRVTVTGLPAGVWASIRNFEIYDRPFTADLVPFKLVNRKSGKVLDISGASTADGAGAIQGTDTGGTNQQFRLVANADGSYRMVNVKSGKVLDSPNSSAVGAQLDQYADNGGDNQAWKLVASTTAGYYRIVNVKTGWYVDVSGASTADGAQVIQWTGTGGSNQDWQLVAV